jgi:hypothetical protein
MKVEQIKGAFLAAVVGSWSAREITGAKADELMKLADELSDESWIRFYAAMHYAIAQSRRDSRGKAR